MPKAVKCEMLCAGFREQDGEIHDAWCVIDDINNLGDPIPEGVPFKLYDATKRIAVDAQPGQIFSFEGEIEDDGISIYPETQEYLGMWLNPADVAKWTAVHQTLHKRMNLKKAQKKDAEARYDLELLRPLREAFRSLGDVTDRELLLSRVIAFITRGERKK
jgi:hypothetical protein